jgi:hypothetical protein
MRVVIENIIEAAIKCGSRFIIINPFSGYKFMEKDPAMAARIWHDMLTNQRAIENIKKVVFTSEESNKFNLFKSEFMNISDSPMIEFF